MHALAYTQKRGEGEVRQDNANVYTHVHVCLCVCVNMYVCMYACMHDWMHVCVCVYLCTQTEKRGGCGEGHADLFRLFVFLVWFLYAAAVRLDVKVPALQYL